MNKVIYEFLEVFKAQTEKEEQDGKLEVRKGIIDRQESQGFRSSQFLLQETTKREIVESAEE